MSSTRIYDVVVFGATGFTGELVAQYLTENSTASFAIAGRSRAKLLEVAKGLLPFDKKGRFNGKVENVPLIIADSANENQLNEMCASTKVVISTVGPYAKYGYPLVEACIKSKCDYVDLTGEPPFIKACIDNYHEKAKAAGVKIVNSCGFDSIPSDLGTLLITNYFKGKGLETDNVRLSVKAVRGGASGGTIASASNIIGGQSWGELRKMQNPDYLADKPPSTALVVRKSPINSGTSLSYDKGHKSWQAPFIMEATNLRLVRRTNSLLKYGDQFNYGESMGISNFFYAFFMTLTIAIGGFLFLFAPFRWAVGKILPPGSGPTEAARKAGFFKIDLYGEAKTSEGQVLSAKATVKGKGDPGYQATSLMIAESALCLALDKDKLKDKKNTGNFTLHQGGILTPASAMGMVLIERLKSKGMVFDLLPSPAK